MKLSENLCIRELAGKKIIYGSKTGDKQKIICLNSTGCWLIEKLKGLDFTPEEVTNLLCAQFDVDSQTAGRDVCTVLEVLKDNNLLEN